MQKEAVFTGLLKMPAREQCAHCAAKTENAITCACFERAYCSEKCRDADPKHVCPGSETDCPVCFEPLVQELTGEGSEALLAPHHFQACLKQVCGACYRHIPRNDDGARECPLCRKPGF